MSYSYGDIQPGYKNPLEGSGSIKKDYDWGSFSKGVDWNQTPEIDRSGLFESLFDKTRQTDKYRSRAERESDYDSDRAFGGEWNRPSSGQVLENLGVVYPQQQSPMYLPGQQGRPGLFSQIAGVAAPFANLIPGAGPVISAGLGAVSQTGW
jgi:hypothetical protein